MARSLLQITNTKNVAQTSWFRNYTLRTNRSGHPLRLISCLSGPLGSVYWQWSLAYPDLRRCVLTVLSCLSGPSSVCTDSDLLLIRTFFCVYWQWSLAYPDLRLCVLTVLSCLSGPSSVCTDSAVLLIRTFVCVYWQWSLAYPGLRLCVLTVIRPYPDRWAACTDSVRLLIRTAGLCVLTVFACLSEPLGCVY
jgi:hypothetical protein